MSFSSIIIDVDVSVFVSCMSLRNRYCTEMKIFQSYSFVTEDCCDHATTHVEEKNVLKIIYSWSDLVHLFLFKLINFST